ncbi:uncharacterized protein LOC121391940 [Gigantopelta aegis]|uniref:uncharacterized protein LOC121391940 n=1 Tax=Gigantopelta aegis TaxID=1735272 RepID=UPI001B88DA6F|nr:uncharacterized protein LOC121391940 [Gigantopelta aegis]
MDKQTTLLPTKDQIVSVTPEVDFILYHVNDGEPLANYIKQRFSDKRLMCSVHTKDFDAACKSNTRRTDPNVAKVTVLIASPMMLSLLPQTKPFARDLFPNPELTVVICIHTEMGNVAKLMTEIVDRFEKWTKCLIGDDRASFRNCLVTLMTMLEDYDTEPLPAMKLFQVVPSTINSKTEKIHIIFTKEIQGQVEVRYCGHVVSTVVYNPYTVIFSPSASRYVRSAEIEVTIDGISLGTEEVLCLSKKEEVCQLLHDVLNPVEFLSETLFSEKISAEDLDGRLAKAMESDIHVKLIDAFRHVENVKWDDYTTQQDQPTLLHFAAKLGLQKLATVLLKMPGAIHACRMFNCIGWSAEDVAQIAGHSELADDIRTFKEGHDKACRQYPGKDAGYVEMKKSAHVSRTTSNVEHPVAPPVPTSPRPNTDPKYIHAHESSTTRLGDGDNEWDIMRRPRSKGSVSIYRDVKVINSESLRRQISREEKSRPNRVTVLIEDSLDLSPPSNNGGDSDRAEREYATIGEFLEDYKSYTSLAKTTGPPLPEKDPSTPGSAINSHAATQERKTQPQESIYSFPKPITNKI